MIKISDKHNWYPDNKLKIIYNKYNKCYWCGRKTFYWSQVDKKVPPNNSASVDHLFSKTDIRRMFYRARDICSPIVLACYKCNNERGSIILEEYAEKVGKKIDFEYQYIYN